MVATTAVITATAITGHGHHGHHHGHHGASWPITITGIMAITTSITVITTLIATGTGAISVAITTTLMAPTSRRGFI